MTIEIDHIGLAVSDYERAKAFYAAALAPLRMYIVMEFTSAETGGEPIFGLGADGKPFLWIGGGGKTAPHAHIAIRAESRAQVDAFHAAALAAGGSDNGGPGLRPHYHEHYYGAFILDPDGHNIEAVIHTPPVVAKAARRKPAPKTAKAPARRAAAKRSPAKRGAAKKAPAKRAAAAKKPARKTAARKPAKRGKKTR